MTSVPSFRQNERSLKAGWLQEQRVFIASYLEMLDAVGALQAEFARSDAVLKAIRPSALNDAFADLS